MMHRLIGFVDIQQSKIVPSPQQPSSHRKLYKLDDNNLKAIRPQGKSSDKELTTPSMSLFSATHLHLGLLEALNGRFGLAAKATPIQALSIQHFTSEKVTAAAGSSSLPNNPVLLAAETGSGKTLA